MIILTKKENLYEFIDNCLQNRESEWDLVTEFHLECDVY